MVALARRQNGAASLWSTDSRPEISKWRNTFSIWSDRTNPSTTIEARVFSGPENAFRLVELIALDLEMRGEGEWSGWRINGRNAHGEEYFSFPVPSLG
jgi:hypothetical protein